MIYHSLLHEVAICATVIYHSLLHEVAICATGNLRYSATVLQFKIGYHQIKKKFYIYLYLYRYIYIDVKIGV